MGRAKTQPKELDHQLGKDELNLAEFPIAVIGKRPPGGVRTLTFNDRVFDRQRGDYVRRTLTVTGSDLLGLPTQLDDEVLLGCVQLSKATGFCSRTLEFTRYELLRLLGRPVDGRNYRRVSESLDRWAGTLVISDRAWWDKKRKSWVKDTFNIIDRVNLVDKESRPSSHVPHQRSWLIWGDFMWRSFQAGNLKQLDFEFWKTLRWATSKRLYRLLDKRFWHTPIVTFDLHVLAYEKLGLSRTMHTGQLKQKLGPANDELRDRGVCDAKITRRERGRWQVVYTKKADKCDRGRRVNSTLAQELIDRGVTAEEAPRLAGKYAQERISEKIRLFDWHKSGGRRIEAGFLVKAIRDDYSLPEQLRRTTNESKVLRRKLKERRKHGMPDEREARQRQIWAEKEAKLEQYLGRLSANEMERLEARALEAARPFLRARYVKAKAEGSPFLDEYRRMILADYID